MGKGGILLRYLVTIYFLFEYLCVKRHYGRFYIWEGEEHIRKAIYHLLNKC